MLKKRALVLVLAMTMLLTILSGCSKGQNKEVVATVDDEKIYLNEALLYLRLTEQSFNSIGGEDIWEMDFDGKKADQLAKERAMESVIQAKILKHKAQEMSIELSDEDINMSKEQAKGIMESIGKDKLQAIGISEEEVQEMVKESLLMSKVFDTIEFIPDEEEIQKQLDEIFAEFESEDATALMKKIKAQMLTFKTAEYKDQKWVALDEESQNKAKVDAEKAYNRLKAGENFVDVLKDYETDEKVLENNGEVTFAKGQAEKIVTDELFALQPGEISSLIEAEHGYIIGKVIEFIEPTEEEIQNFNTQMEQYKQQIRTQKTQEEKQKKLNEKYLEWKEKTSIEIKNEVWDNVEVQKN